MHAFIRSTAPTLAERSPNANSPQMPHIYLILSFKFWFCELSKSITYAKFAIACKESLNNPHSMSATLEQKKKELIDSLSIFPDSYERFTYIVDLAKEKPDLPEDYRIDSFKVEGCLSQLWVVPSLENGKCHFRADSDSSIVKGMAGILCDFYSGEEPEAILAVEPDFLDEVGLLKHLTGNRRNGLSKVRERIVHFAESAREKVG